LLLKHRGVGADFADSVLGHHVLNSIFRVTGLLESHGGVFACPVHQDNGSPRVFELIFGDVIDSVVDDDPDVGFGVVLGHFLPSVRRFLRHLLNQISIWNYQKSYH
jgi:hypothetical protein